MFPDETPGATGSSGLPGIGTGTRVRLVRPEKTAWRILRILGEERDSDRRTIWE